VSTTGYRKHVTEPLDLTQMDPDELARHLGYILLSVMEDVPCAIFVRVPGTGQLTVLPPRAADQFSDEDLVTHLLPLWDEDTIEAWLAEREARRAAWATSSI